MLEHVKIAPAYGGLYTVIDEWLSFPGFLCYARGFRGAWLSHERQRIRKCVFECLFAIHEMNAADMSFQLAAQPAAVYAHR
jgi:hypothetical protein